MRGTRMPWPQRTTRWGGTLLVIAALGLLLLQVHPVVAPVSDAAPAPLSGPWTEPSLLAFRCAGLVVLAAGVAGELGIAARSVAGRIALVLWGMLPVVVDLVLLVPVAGTGLLVEGVVAAVASAGGAGAGLVAAVVVLRVRVLLGIARWLLLPLAAADAVVAVGDLSPWPAVLAATSAVAAAVPLLLLATGVALLLYGRSQSVAHRLQVIRDAW